MNSLLTKFADSFSIITESTLCVQFFSQNKLLWCPKNWNAKASQKLHLYTCFFFLILKKVHQLERTGSAFKHRSETHHTCSQSSLVAASCFRNLHNPIQRLRISSVKSFSQKLHHLTYFGGLWRFAKKCYGSSCLFHTTRQVLYVFTEETQQTPCHHPQLQLVKIFYLEMLVWHQWDPLSALSHAWGFVSAHKVFVCSPWPVYLFVFTHMW